MTLTRRLTIVVMGWVIIILAVFNIIFLAWVQTQAMTNLRNALHLQLANVARLTNQMPHFAVTTGWEESELVNVSIIEFIDSSGHVTSSGWTSQFPVNAFTGARNVWMPAIKSDIRDYGSTMGGFPPVNTPRPSDVSGTAPEPVSPFDAQTRVFNQTPGTDGRHQFVGLEQPFTYPDGSAGAIVIASTTDSLMDAMHNALSGLFWTDGPVLLIAGLGTYLVISRGLRPIQALIEAVKHVETSLVSRVFVGRSPLEIQKLVGTLNQLFDRVDASLQEQRRFVSDASHELRTPLSIIAGHANMLRRWGNTNPEVWEPAVHHIVNEVGRLQMLVDNLLLLARIDAGDKPEFEPISGEKLRQMMTQLREDGKVLRPDLQWTSSVHVSTKRTVLIQANALRQVLVSLIENATKHTDAGGVVQLSLVMESDHTTIAVADSGHGIDPDDLPFVFERFYRGHSGRGTKSGAGLGLSICKQLIEAYGGTIWVESVVGEGTTVRIQLPTVDERQEHPSAIRVATRSVETRK